MPIMHFPGVSASSLAPAGYGAIMDMMENGTVNVTKAGVLPGERLSGPIAGAVDLTVGGEKEKAVQLCRWVDPGSGFLFTGCSIAEARRRAGVNWDGGD